MRKVNSLQGRATLQGPRALTVAGANGRTQLRFEHAILATGSQPTRIPSLSLDSSRMMDSTDALDLPDVPASLLVVGGGYIGLELGSVYATLGSRVSVVEMMPGLLPGADRDLVSVLHTRLETLFASITWRCPELSPHTSPHGPGRGGGVGHCGAPDQAPARSPRTWGWRRRWLRVGRVGGRSTGAGRVGSGVRAGDRGAR